MGFLTLAGHLPEVIFDANFDLAVCLAFHVVTTPTRYARANVCPGRMSEFDETPIGMMPRLTSAWRSCSRLGLAHCRHRAVRLRASMSRLNEREGQKR